MMIEDDYLRRYCTLGSAGGFYADEWAGAFTKQETKTISLFFVPFNLKLGVQTGSADRP
jgi:hypothetical protein